MSSRLSLVNGEDCTRTERQEAANKRQAQTSVDLEECLNCNSEWGPPRRLSEVTIATVKKFRNVEIWYPLWQPPSDDLPFLLCISLCPCRCHPRRCIAGTIPVLPPLEKIYGYPVWSSPHLSPAYDCRLHISNRAWPPGCAVSDSPHAMPRDIGWKSFDKFVVVGRNWAHEKTA